MCDSCKEAFIDEGFDGDPEEMAWFGADIPDHTCDYTETDGEVSCTCACHKEKVSA